MTSESENVKEKITNDENSSDNNKDSSPEPPKESSEDVSEETTTVDQPNQQNNIVDEDNTTKKEVETTAPSEDKPPPPKPNDDNASPPPNETKPPTPTPTPPPVENNKRTLSHQKLRAYESCRRSSYQDKLSSSSLYWRSFRSLLKSSLDETRRAERLVRARALADSTYAAHMTSAFEDCLEDDGTAVLDLKKKKKILYSRGLDVNVTTTGLSSSSSMNSMFSDEKRLGMLSQLTESHSVLAERYEETSRMTNEEIVPELAKLTQTLAEEVVSIEALGDAILEELEAAEEEVVKAWEAYYNAAVLSLAGGTSDSPQTKRHGASNTPTTGNEFEVLENVSDVWIFEMRYRMSVAFLSACWDKCSSELSRLFASMKETECIRRYKLRELLITFMQRQERLWVGLQSTLQPALKDLLGRPIDRKSIENDVQSSIRLRAQDIQRNEQQQQQQQNQTKKQTSSLGITKTNLDEGNFELSSPLVSDLLCKAKVIERKHSGMMSAWKTTLAIVTADSFLHLYDIPSTKKLQSGCAPEVAFHMLVPPVEIPTEKTIKSGAKIPKTWNENLSPAESIVLPNATISFQDTEQNSAFEIVETVINQGAGKMWGKTWNRKLYLRTLSYQETADWIECLKRPSSGDGDGGKEGANVLKRC